VFELHAFHLANGDAFASGAHGRRAIWMERMPGTSLREHLGAGTLDERMLAAAGAEIGRVHRLHSDAFAGPWSHGDLHLENALYDPAEGRVRLIDFETVHEDGLDPIDRHADDLLVPILDLIGACDGDVLGRRVRALLEGYDNPAMASPLRRRLVMPSGLESVLWHTRTSFIAEAALAARIEVARDAVGAS
jgi:tRNA A-37 threonylcarbamoyl transferase component Bud32